MICDDCPASAPTDATGAVFFVASFSMGFLLHAFHNGSHHPDDLQQIRIHAGIVEAHTLDGFNELVKFFATKMEYHADEIGVLQLKQVPKDELSAGNVGYIISGIKTSSEVKVGDTITHVDTPCDRPIEGFENVKPMVFAGVYPVSADDYEELRASLEKLQLNDASLVWEPESSAALGFGFRCGFLGLLHMEIVQERLDREFDMDVITTVPNVSFKAYLTDGEELDVHNPSGLPEVTKLDHIDEPFIIAEIITKNEFVGSIMKLCIYRSRACR